MKLYIAGPMTGLPEFNYPAFFAAETRLQALGVGVEVLNPARNGPAPASGPHEAWQWYMRESLGQVLQADVVVLLDDWQISRGACEEKRLAGLLGIPAVPFLEWVLPQESMLAELRAGRERKL